MGTGWSQDEASQQAQCPANYNHEAPEVVQQQQQQQQLPHNYEGIVKDADTPIENSGDNLLQQLHAGVFLNQKRKKYWVDKKLNNCFMMYARDIKITWAEDARYWRWLSLQEASDVFVDVAELVNVCWLEVHGKFDTAKLSPGILYEAVFVVKLKYEGYGWEVPVNVRLTLPDGNKQFQKVNLLEVPIDKWIEIPVGEFRSPERFGEIEISMYDYDSGRWKKGLLIKGIAIRPKDA